MVSERPRGVFSRQLILGDTLDTENVKANYADGVLTLRIPVLEAAKPRKIEISRRRTSCRRSGSSPAAVPARRHASGSAGPAGSGCMPTEAESMPGRNPDPRGYYALLHVSPEASRQEIGRAFRALMRRHHPDVGQSDVDRSRCRRHSARFRRAAGRQEPGGVRRRRLACRPSRTTPSSTGTTMPAKAAATSRCASSGVGIPLCACSPSAGNPGRDGETLLARPLTRAGTHPAVTSSSPIH